ncbi:MAG: hypothetical protein EBX35_08595 [Planctomycetia bacterium]|nr:hypothetical protein [Planctomycetia bacterium]
MRSIPGRLAAGRGLRAGGPGIPANERSEALLYLFDLLPTLGGMCGVAGPEGSEGLDLGGCVRDPRKPGRERLVFAYRDVQRAVADPKPADWVPPAKQGKRTRNP